MMLENHRAIVITRGYLEGCATLPFGYCPALYAEEDTHGGGSYCISDMVQEEHN
jgi:hypothetical protein